MDFPKPKRYLAEVSDLVYLNAKTLLLTFELEEPETIEFLPGQFINIDVGNGLYRAYSICSDADVKNKISVVLTVAHDGVGANFLKSRKVEDTIVFIGPSGRFVLHEPFKQNILFLVTGTGIAPIIPMLHEISRKTHESKIKVYFGLRSHEDIFFADKLKDFEHYICLSQVNGRITRFYRVDDVTATQVYVCGNPNMVSEVVEQLHGLGVPDDSVFQEKFIVAHHS